VRSAFSYGLYDEANIRLRTEVEGGALMDVGCYNVSGSRLLGGEPTSVHGEAWFGPSGTDWVFAGTLRFPGDVIATFDCSTAMTERDELEAIGSEGSLFLDDPWHCNVPVIEVRRGDGVERIELERTDSYRLELENLSDAIRGEGEPLLGREDAIGQARTLEALYESATRGTPVAL
jgi:D-xylose 1-dehydrogenase (NADP+, D-xylono-1,5-lactone-forming)